jgi:hypothetical protein
MFRDIIGCIIIVVVNGFEEDLLQYMTGTYVSSIDIS